MGAGPTRLLVDAVAARVTAQVAARAALCLVAALVALVALAAVVAVAVALHQEEQHVAHLPDAARRS